MRAVPEVRRYFYALQQDAFWREEALHVSFIKANIIIQCDKLSGKQNHIQYSREILIINIFRYSYHALCCEILSYKL